MHRIRRHVSFANVIAVIALFFALGGTAAVVGAGLSTGKIVAYAKVKKNGDVVASKSLNVSSANVTRESTSSYCFRNLSFSFKGAQVTIDYSGVSDGRTEQAEFAKGSPFADCAVTAQAEVATSNGSSFAPEPFYIEFYK